MGRCRHYNFTRNGSRCHDANPNYLTTSGLATYFLPGVPGCEPGLGRGAGRGGLGTERPVERDLAVRRLV